ncbi:hypothetical protein HOG48_01950 [Candidatus Peregrinibacteria bacterium]|jgi:hypothetical protein|nr:hypothetical protein [Candidatus Peregrinibacteria bacterium]
MFDEVFDSKPWEVSSETVGPTGVGSNAHLMNPLGFNRGEKEVDTCNALEGRRNDLAELIAILAEYLQGVKGSREKLADWCEGEDLSISDDADRLTAWCEFVGLAEKLGIEGEALLRLRAHAMLSECSPVEFMLEHGETIAATSAKFRKEVGNVIDRRPLQVAC